MTCLKNYTLVEGYNFGYCYNDPAHGSYFQTLYTNDKNYCKVNNLLTRPTVMTRAVSDS